MTVDQFTGTEITPAGAELIKARRADKAALLAEMRADRANAALDRHSHVGAELGRSVAELEGLRLLYQRLAALSNELFTWNHQHASGTVASLARGVQRAAMEYYGKEAAESLDDISQPEPVRATNIEPEPLAPLTPSDKARYEDTGPSDISQSEAPSSDERVDPEPEIIPVKPAAMAPLTKADASPVTPLATFEDDEPDDQPGALEEVVSPVVEESPRVLAARKRREAKRASQSN